MPGLILCRSKIAEEPFYIKSADLNIYSLEELCYYIYNNIYILEGEFINQHLIHYIEEELCEPPLADKLKTLIVKKAGLRELVLTILKYVDYYSVADIERIKNVLDSLNTMNVSRRLKMRGDSFLNNKRYYSAIKNYMEVFKVRREKEMPEGFYGDVYHNMGVCFARLFLYQIAADCFEQAYRLNQNKESEKEYELAVKMYERAEGELTEELSEADREVEKLMNDVLYEDEKADIVKWKEDYLKYIS